MAAEDKIAVFVLAFLVSAFLLFANAMYDARGQKYNGMQEKITRDQLLWECMETHEKVYGASNDSLQICIDAYNGKGSM